jgi:arylsulfatase A-like enzyme
MKSTQLFVCVFFVAYVSICHAQEAKPHPPNVIFILSDDLGVSEISPYGGKLKTTTLDQMTAEGLRFTSAYATPLCGPTRCSLMTGLHPGHMPIRHNPSQARGWNRTDQGDPPLADGTPTFAKVFKQAGYRTACIGKWGLGLPGKEGSPDRMGFDYFFGYDSHVAAHNYYPDHLWRDNEQVKLDGKTYTHDLFSTEALKFIEQNKAQPFMLYLAYTIPHGRYEPPSDEPFSKESWPPAEKKYAAMMMRMDRDIGRIFSLLKDLKLDENTLVIFASDNGPLNFGGHKANFFAAPNPLRGLKGGAYEGGERIAFIARWPGHVPAGQTTDQPIATWDFLATCAELVGQDPPKTDGISYLPTLLGRRGEQKQHDYLYWELAVGDGLQQIRMGNWKAEIFGISKSNEPKLELYDLKSDLREQHDLATDNPEVVNKMREIAKEAHTPDRMFPLTVEEMRTAAPKAVLKKAKEKAAQEE